MPTEMKIICPYCGYDHEKELQSELDAWISDEPYETECICGNQIIVHTHITYSFAAMKSNRYIKIGDTVEVVGTESIPFDFLGKKGTVTDLIGGVAGKAVVEFIPREGTTGSLSHTAFFSDLKKV